MTLVKTMKWLVIACLGSVLVYACGELDPVSVKNLCVGPGPFSDQCPQCQSVPFASQCPQCQQSGADEGTCLPAETSETMVGPSTTSDGGSGATPDNGQSGEGATPDSGPNKSNGGNNAVPGDMGIPGSAGRAASGMAGVDAPGQPGNAGGPGQQGPVLCASDGDCTAMGFPACRPDGLCTECLTDEHCPGRQCDMPNHRCVECVADPICEAQGKVCDLATRACVQCRDDSHCSAETPACSLSQECVACVKDSHCPMETPACDDMACYECTGDQYCTGDKHACIEDERRCVECDQEVHCRGVDGRPHCAQAENVCVECLEDADCSDRSASHCDSESHTCVPCGSHDHCEQFAGSAPRCAGGECVACDENGGICNGRACILSQNVCSTKQRQSEEACGECVTSDECKQGLVCVNVKFGSYNTGNFCLPNLPDYPSCPRPFGRKVTGQTTLDGRKVETLCMLPDTTTCQALLDTKAKKTCNSNNAACGLGLPVLGVNDGMCPGSVCTYNCPSSSYCPDDMTCSSEQKVCIAR